MNLWIFIGVGIMIVVVALIAECIGEIINPDKRPPRHL